MKVAELRAKKAEELNGLVASLKKEQFNLRFQAATGELQNTIRVRQVRREIARIKTVLKEQALTTTGQAKVSPSKTRKSKVKKG